MKKLPKNGWLFGKLLIDIFNLRSARQELAGKSWASLARFLGGVCRNGPGFPNRLDGALRRPGIVNFKAPTSRPPTRARAPRSVETSARLFDVERARRCCARPGTRCFGRWTGRSSPSAWPWQWRSAAKEPRGGVEGSRVVSEGQTSPQTTGARCVQDLFDSLTL